MKGVKSKVETIRMDEDENYTSDRLYKITLLT